MFYTAGLNQIIKSSEPLKQGLMQAWTERMERSNDVR